MDAILLAKGPANDIPLGVPANVMTGDPTPGTPLRYWRVGLCVVEEDDGWTHVLGRDSLKRLDCSPRIVLPGQQVPHALAMTNPDGGRATFDSVLRQIEESVTLWSRDLGTT